MRLKKVIFGITLVLASLICFLGIKCHRLSPEDAKMERLFRALQNPDDEILPYVVERLAKSGSNRATDALLSALKTSDPMYRSFIATGLGFVKDKRATPALLQALRDGDRQLQYSAARALARRRDPAALETLLTLIKDPSAEIRHNTIYALWTMKDPRIFEALRNALRDPDEEVRAAAVRGIALSGDAGAIELLYSSLKDNAMVSSVAAEYLALMPDNSGTAALERAFEIPDPSWSLPLERGFYALKSNGLKPESLISFLLHKLESGPDVLRIRAAEDLASFEDTRVIDALMQGTADPNPIVRSSAIRSLHRLNNPRADAFILTHAKNRSSNVHAIAAQAVCERMDPRNSLLIAGFLKEKDVHVQFSAATALTSMADPRTISAITAAAAQKNEDWIHKHIITALVKALAKSDTPRALEELSSMLQKRNEQYQAAEALASMSNPRAGEILAEEYERNPEGRPDLMWALADSKKPLVSAILMKGLKDKDPEVRRAAALATGNLPDPFGTADSLIKSLDNPDLSAKVAAINRLAKMSSAKAVPVLIRNLESPVGDKAAKALGEIGDKRAAIPLLEILQKPSSSCPSSYPDLFLRAAAAEALGRVGDYKSVPALLKALEEFSPRTSRGAAIALGALKDKRAVNPLIKALAYEHCSVRESAASALGEIGDSRAISALVPHLSEVEIRSGIIAALSKLQWRPQTDRERTYVRLEQQKWNEISGHWPISRSILLSDLKAEDPETVQSAAFALIAIGTDDTLKELADALKNAGTYMMGLVYYNSGQPQLRMAAIQWAFNEGVDYFELGTEKPVLVWRGHDLAGVSCRTDSY